MKHKIGNQRTKKCIFVEVDYTKEMTTNAI